jgi:hypothetical protein
MVFNDKSSLEKVDARAYYVCIDKTCLYPERIESIAGSGKKVLRIFPVRNVASWQGGL